MKARSQYQVNQPGTVYSCNIYSAKYLVTFVAYYRTHSEGMGKVLFSQVSVCKHLRGVPHPSWGYPSWPGVPHLSQPVGGTPPWPAGGGVPHLGHYGVPPARMGYPTVARMGYPPARMGYIPARQSIALHRKLATRGVVCLLRSRRRTFLFFDLFS